MQEKTISDLNIIVHKLTFQGDFFKLLIDEEDSLTWQSISQNIPRVFLSFSLKACSNGLNTPGNLKLDGVGPVDNRPSTN